MVSGQPRPEPPAAHPRTPLVIIAAGLGGVAAEHVMVAQLISPFARVLRWDRAGYGASTPLNPDKDSYAMEHAVRDLFSALETINLPPPYVLVGQSWGGLAIREILRQRGAEEILGMVFVDANPHLQRADMRELEEMIGTCCGADGYERVVGLHQNSIFSPSQIAGLEHDSDKAEKSGVIPGEASAAEESQATVDSAFGLKAVEDADGRTIDLSFSKQPLGNGRISVIHGDIPRDLGCALQHGKTHGLGNEELHGKLERYIEYCKRVVSKFQAAQTQLTKGEVRVRRATGTGRTHNLQSTRPDIVAEEVRWVLAGCEGGGDKGDLLGHA